MNGKFRNCKIQSFKPGLGKHGNYEIAFNALEYFFGVNRCPQKLGLIKAIVLTVRYVDFECNLNFLVDLECLQGKIHYRVVYAIIEQLDGHIDELIVTSDPNFLNNKTSFLHMWIEESRVLRLMMMSACYVSQSQLTAHITRIANKRILLSFIMDFVVVLPSMNWFLLSVNKTRLDLITLRNYFRITSVGRFIGIFLFYNLMLS